MLQVRVPQDRKEVIQEGEHQEMEEVERQETEEDESLEREMHQVEMDPGERKVEVDQAAAGASEGQILPLKQILFVTRS